MAKCHSVGGEQDNSVAIVGEQDNIAKYGKLCGPDLLDIHVYY